MRRARRIASLPSVPLVPLLAVVALTAHSGEAGWTGYARISELTPTAKHYYELHLPLKSSAGCEESGSFYQDYSAQGADAMYRALLEALSAGLAVRVYVTGACNLHGYAEISAIGVSRK